jgi:hypothetical protein
MANDVRKPRVGDHVAAIAQNGVAKLFAEKRPGLLFGPFSSTTGIAQAYRQGIVHGKSDVAR